MPAVSLPYHEPGLEDILILSSFLLTLNIVNSVLDRTLYCGLVGQVFVGVAWGTPGGGWLSEPVKHAIVQLGYLGLIMIVFEGGSSNSLPTMRANLLLSSCVALTGIAAPIGLSFLLGPLAGAAPLQSFAAGAALCSTSLGTTFTVLSTSGGGAAGGNNIAPAIVVRPVFVSVAFAVAVPLACRFVLRPLMAYVWRKKQSTSKKQKHSEQEQSRGLLSRLTQAGQSALLVQTGVLLGLVAAAGYAGASVLLAAYLAGIVASWWRDERAALVAASPSSEQVVTGGASSTAEDTGSSSAPHPPTTAREDNANASSDSRQQGAAPKETDTRDMYSTYYGDSVERILKPFFFASIGFSIPISRMFSGPVVWRGIIYTVLMILGKTLCGAWLVRFPLSVSSLFKGMYSSASRTARILLQGINPGKLIHQRPQKGQGEKSSVIENTEQSTGQATMPHGQTDEANSQHTPTAPATSRSAPQAKQSSQPRKPLSLYPSGIVSSAMVARGEIGFLISSVAESKGIFRSSSSPSEEEVSEIFLIITWAIVLCTILGPLCVGLLVRRVKKLEGRSAQGQVEGDRKNVLGVWGVS
ncbi:Sodium/hydrogen exchanger family-domain-containing protein [Apiospora phragmitis]|uniref:Sodium/hydrogen exchanger family-domain-containing protein n=1 Tax=Apiospora phragmitis TaxID=2905665 RepID=A0ABR1WTY2_9PEZI